MNLHLPPPGAPKLLDLTLGWGSAAGAAATRAGAMRTRAAVKRVVKDILLVVYTKDCCTGVRL